jgi:hypothetical protein
MKDDLKNELSRFYYFMVFYSLFIIRFLNVASLARFCKAR